MHHVMLSVPNALCADTFALCRTTPYMQLRFSPVVERRRLADSEADDLLLTGQQLHPHQGTGTHGRVEPAVEALTEVQRNWE